jgi:hypothetical protein
MSEPIHGHITGEPSTAPGGPFTIAPDPIEYTDKMVEDVCNAWTNPGPHVVYHREMQEKLEREWPVLANAIKNLVKGTR